MTLPPHLFYKMLAANAPKSHFGNYEALPPIFPKNLKLRNLQKGVACGKANFDFVPAERPGLQKGELELLPTERPGLQKGEVPNLSTSVSLRSYRSIFH